MRILIVTDPLCSWCWGMSSAVEQAMSVLGSTVAFDFLLGGINVHGTHPIGEFGRRHLRKVWADVQATTGQSFGNRLPDDMVYNSVPACTAIHAVRQFLGKPPFGYLHRLQQKLFVDSQDITRVDVLCDTARELGWPPEVVSQGVDDPAIVERVTQEFSSARSYGTNALPAVLFERDGERRLLAGGYADADMLVALVRAALEKAGDDGPETIHVHQK